MHPAMQGLSGEKRKILMHTLGCFVSVCFILLCFSRNKEQTPCHDHGGYTPKEGLILTMQEADAAVHTNSNEELIK